LNNVNQLQTICPRCGSMNIWEEQEDINYIAKVGIDRCHLCLTLYKFKGVEFDKKD